MSDAPKRGRPPAAALLLRFRVKAPDAIGSAPRLQIAVSMGDGIAWRDVPVVPPDAPDWEAA